MKARKKKLYKVYFNNFVSYTRYKDARKAARKRKLYTHREVQKYLPKGRNITTANIFFSPLSYNLPKIYKVR